MDTKTCTKCGKTKQANARNFYVRNEYKNPATAYRNVCKDCMLEHRLSKRIIRSEIGMDKRYMDGYAKSLPTRKCKTCSETMPLNNENFEEVRTYRYVNKIKTDIPKWRFRGSCRSCHNESEKKYRVKFYSNNANQDKKRVWQKQYFEKNQKRILSSARNKRIENKTKAIAHLGGKCVDCVKQGRDGIFPPCAMDFHHLDPTQKEHKPSALLMKEWAVFKTEVDKCELLCSNCHRIRHYEEGIAA
tara:strand:+ start:310 stop:1044 length:735 start_codon:yes stop_codon:yes gene_type:complete